MTIWNKSNTTFLYYTYISASENNSCGVKITADRILVEYEDEEGLMQSFSRTLRRSQQD